MLNALSLNKNVIFKCYMLIELKKKKKHFVLCYIWTLQVSAVEKRNLMLGET